MTKLLLLIAIASNADRGATDLWRVSRRDRAETRIAKTESAERCRRLAREMARLWSLPDPPYRFECRR